MITDRIKVENRQIAAELFHCSCSVHCSEDETCRDDRSKCSYCLAQLHLKRRVINNFHLSLLSTTREEKLSLKIVAIVPVEITRWSSDSTDDHRSKVSARIPTTQQQNLLLFHSLSSSLVLLSKVREIENYCTRQDPISQVCWAHFFLFDSILAQVHSDNICEHATKVTPTTTKALNLLPGNSYLFPFTTRRKLAAEGDSHCVPLKHPTEIFYAGENFLCEILILLISSRATIWCKYFFTRLFVLHFWKSPWWDYKQTNRLHACNSQNAIICLPLQSNEPWQ